METTGYVSNIGIDHEDKIHIKNKTKQEIKSETFYEVEGVHEEFNDDAIIGAGDIPNNFFDIKQEIKTEALDEVEEVHNGSNEDVITRASDVPNIYFDHENNIPIKKEIKQEIKSEPGPERRLTDHKMRTLAE